MAPRPYLSWAAFNIGLGSPVHFLSIDPPRSPAPPPDTRPRLGALSPRATAHKRTGQVLSQPSLQSIVRVMAATFTALSLLLSSPIEAEEPYPEELCKVMVFIETLFGKDGPLKGCRDGDTAHFQINKTLVSPASVAARYCDFNFQILTDTLPKSGLTHLVCKYKWIWAKQVEMEKHPDSR